MRACKMDAHDFNRERMSHPHVGSGTTCIAARMLNRYSIGIDMEESYLRDIAVPKLKEMAKQKSILDFGSD